MSLKKREMSADGGKDETKEKSPVRTSFSLSSPSQEGKSPMSVDSDVPAVGSPLEPLPPPVSVLGNGEYKLRLYRIEAYPYLSHVQRFENIFHYVILRREFQNLMVKVSKFKN